jgi:hypothetical protein
MLVVMVLAVWLDMVNPYSVATNVMYKVLVPDEIAFRYRSGAPQSIIIG